MVRAFILCINYSSIAFSKFEYIVEGNILPFHFWSIHDGVGFNPFSPLLTLVLPEWMMKPSILKVVLTYLESVHEI